MSRFPHHVQARDAGPSGSMYKPKRTGFWGLERRARPVYEADLRGVEWDELWDLEYIDHGAAAILVQSDSPRDGLLLNVALRDDNVHPWIVKLSDAGETSIWFNGRRVAYRRDAGTFLRSGEPTWVWFRLTGRRMEVGLGDRIGEQMILEGKTPNNLGGGYMRFGIGRTNFTTTGFFIHDVVPMRRREKVVQQRRFY